MYTAKIIQKEELPQGLKMSVEFSNGAKTIAETVIPQDEAGFRHWLRSRIISLNSIEELDSKYEIDTTVSPYDKPVTKTDDELEQEQWFKNYYQWVRVKTTLIDTNIIPATHPKAQELFNSVKLGIKPEYIDKL